MLRLYCSSVSLVRSLLMFCLWASARRTVVCLLKMDSCSYRSFSISCWTLISYSSSVVASSSSASSSSHGFGPDRAQRLLASCVLAKVPAWVTAAEPLRQFGLSWQRRCFGWALLRWWICGLADGVALRGCLQRLGVQDVRRWWGGSGLTVGGGVGYWWILSVVIRLDAGVGSFSSVASPGLSSSLGHCGCQILG
jgi:hypothetical protein